MDSILDNIFIEISRDNCNKKTMLIFLIGSYPNYSKLHEMPPFILNYLNIYNIYIVLIDPIYKKDTIVNIYDTTFTKQNCLDYYECNNNNIKLFIHNKLIDEYDYGKILGFSNFLKLNNNLSFIFEYTSIIRPNYKTFLRNITYSNIWISYSNCMADMNSVINNPIIQNNMIYDITIHSNIYNEYKLNKIINDNISNQKCQYILSCIIQFLNDLEILLSMRSYVKLKVSYHGQVKKDFFYDKSINWIEDKNYLLYRLMGSFKCIYINILDDFENSTYNNLLLYIDSVINNFFMNIYMIVDDSKDFENNYLTFETNEDCRKIIEFYKNKLGVYDIPKEVSII